MSGRTTGGRARLAAAAGAAAAGGGRGIIVRRARLAERKRAKTCFLGADIRQRRRGQLDVTICRRGGGPVEMPPKCETLWRRGSFILAGRLAYVARAPARAPS